MRKQYHLLLCVTTVLLVSLTSAPAQSRADLLRSQAAEKKAVADYRAKNFPGFLENMIEADRLRPNHPRLLYNLADAFALNNKTGEALEILTRLANMGLYFQPEKDEDFKSLETSPENSDAFKSLLQKFAQVKRPVNKSVKAFSLPDKELITEGIAYDRKTGRFFISSIHQRKIVVREKTGEVKDFSALSDGLYSVLGMKVDSKRGLLWACSAAFSQMRGYDAADKGKAGIFKYDLKTGKLLNKYLLSSDDGNHALGDLTLAKNGDVYASDSISPVIYKIAAGADKLEVFLRSDSFASLQGLTFSPDEKYLFAADYSLGFFRIETVSKTVIQLSNPSGQAVLGIDGIYFYKGTLIAIQNGINPQRVGRFSLNADLTAITGYAVLEANHDEFNEPTLGVLDGDEFYFIANSQWELISEKGELEKAKLREPVVLRLKL